MPSYVALVELARAAIEAAKPLAEAFQTGTVKFYVKGNPVPILTCSCRMKKPRPSVFDASTQTDWSTKRSVVLRIPLNATTGVVTAGLIAQISTPDGDPTINQINFVVQSALASQFAVEREVTLVTEVTPTPRIV